MTKPSAPAPNGRVPVAESAPILQNFTKRRGAHVPVDAAADHGVAVSLDEELDRGVDRGEARGAGRVRDEVGAAEVEDVRDAPGDDVRELSGHRVLGDRRQALSELVVPAGEDLAAHVLGQLLERPTASRACARLGEETRSAVR